MPREDYQVGTCLALGAYEIRKRAAVEFSAKQGRIELRRQAGVRAAAWVSKRLCRKRS